MISLGFPAISFSFSSLTDYANDEIMIQNLDDFWIWTHFLECNLMFHPEIVIKPVFQVPPAPRPMMHAFVAPGPVPFNRKFNGKVINNSYNKNLNYRSSIRATKILQTRCSIFLPCSIHTRTTTSPKCIGTSPTIREWVSWKSCEH